MQTPESKTASHVVTLVPIEKRTHPSVMLINSDNFLAYLVGEGDFAYAENGRFRFSKKLRLPYLTSSLIELFESTQPGNVFSDQDREASSKTDFTETSFETEQAKEAYRKLTTELEDFAHMQAVVERSRTVYLDYNDNQFRVSPITHHRFDAGKVDTIDIWNQGNLPLMEIHTHPDNTLLSPVDYWRILGRVFSDSPEGLIRSAILICPDIQILAVATNETQLIEPSMFDERIGRALKFIPQENQRLESLRARFLAAHQASMNLLVKRYEASHQNIIQIDKMYAKGLLTEEETNRLLEENHQQAIRETRYGQERSARVMGRANNHLWDYNNYLFNFYLLKFAREMGIKLYASTNFTDFQEFSA